MASGVAVSDYQVIRDINVSLFHGASISGRIVDRHGDSVEGATIRALRVQRGSRRPLTGGASATNDLGEFRLAHLQPGR